MTRIVRLRGEWHTVPGIGWLRIFFIWRAALLVLFAFGIRSCLADGHPWRGLLIALCGAWMVFDTWACWRAYR